MQARLLGGLSLALLTLLSSAYAQNPGGPDGGVIPDGPDDPLTTSEAGHGYWATRIGFYDKDDSGAGNPFVDESVQVIEPIVIFDYQFSDTFGYNLELSYDRVSSASIDRLSKFASQSGASGDYYAGIKASFRHKLSSQTDLKWHTDVSFEYDYFSLGLGGGLSHSLEPADATISAYLSAYFDTVDLIRYNGVDEGQDDRTSIAGTLSWYQVLSPSTHGEFGLTLSAQDGYLESPINAVVIEDPALPPNPNLANLARGTEIGEELPDSRFRTSLYGRVRHSLSPESAVELGGRLYQDDWGISAFDFTPKYIVELGGGAVWDFRYRYYSQTAADAYQERFLDPLNIPIERTQDSELAEFDSHLLGTHVRWGSQSQWDFGLDYLSRSDNLDHLFFSVGWKTGF